MSSIPTNLQEAAAAAGEIRAGGTDLMERRRHHVSTGSLNDISRLPGLDRIDRKAAGASIGALVSIHAVSADAGLRKDYPAFAMAAGALATPQIRNAGTLGGSLLQRSRCWYFRHEDFSCFKKGGDSCPARKGNHQFGVCFDLGPCVFPHPSTLGMVLMIYGAEVEVHEAGKMKIEALYGDGSNATSDHLLKAGQILTHVHLPQPMAGEKAAYFRSISRARAEWPLVEVAVRYRLSGGKIADARVAMGGVANVPMALPKVEAFLNGQSPVEDVFRKAGKIAAEGANPLPGTEYKVELVEGTVYEALRRAEAGIWGGEG